MDENELSKIILGAAIEVHRELGPGLLESVYEVALTHVLTGHGLHVRRQAAIPFRYRGFEFEEGFRADILVEGAVLIELKSVEKVAPVHRKQLLTYLRLSGLKLGLLINFGEAYVKDGFERIVNGLGRP